MMIFLTVFLFLLAVGGVVVAYGTAAKSKWGINLQRVSCPRCKTSLPSMHEPRSLRQGLWGGWTCPTCGAGVDKWGQEVAASAPPTVVKAEGEVRRVLKKRLILVAPVGFCLMLLLDWTGITDGGFPSEWEEALVQVGANILWTVFFTVTFYFAWSYLLKRFFLKERGRDPVRGDEADRKREV